MQPRLEATLADFVPALRFLSPESVDRYLGHPDLPPAWWTSVPISRAVDAIGAGELPDRLADLAYAELRHLRLGDLLPAAWLARNDFRLSQWPDGVRTNVLVRTPDWADLLGATVQEIGDWTQVGTSTVRPVISQLFAEVLGLLPAPGRTGVSPVVPPGEAPGAESEVAAEPGAVGAAPETAPVAEPEAEDYGPPEEATPVADIPPPSPPRGIRISKRPPVAPAPVPEFEAPSASEDEAFGAHDPGLEPVSDLLDAIEDELRPVSMPAPPTGDLGDVVRWLAEEAPDVPLMSELARVTLETVAVVGIEGAPPEVRTALLRLMALVPETLLPEGLDVSEDAFSVPGAELEDPYDAPEMTAILGAVRADDEAFAPEPAAAAPESGPEPGSEFGSEKEAPSSFGPVGADDLTVLAMPTTPPEPPQTPQPPVGADDLTMLAMPSVAPGSEESGDPDSAAGAGAVHGAGRDSVDAFDAFDAFGEVPPATREDLAVQPADEPPSAADAMDAFGEIPPATREDLPAQSAPQDGRDAADDSVDAFGEIPPSTRDDVPIQRAPRAQEPSAFAARSAPEFAAESDEVLDPTSLGVGPSWIRGGGAKAQPGQDESGSSDDESTIEVGADAGPVGTPSGPEVSWRGPGAAQPAPAPAESRDPRAEAAAAKAAAAARAEAARAEAARAEAASYAEAAPHPESHPESRPEPQPEPRASDAGESESRLPETQQPAGRQGIVIPPRPTAPPPIPPRPTSPPPGPGSESGLGGTPPAEVPGVVRTLKDDDPFADVVGDAADQAMTDATPPSGAAAEPATGNIVMVLASWFTGREPRWRTLARDRMFTDSPREISSIAAEFDKDSAEVAALERALRRHLADQLDQPAGAQVREHLDFVRRSLGPVATVAELRELDDRHTATVPGLGVQLWQVVRGLLELNTSVDGWLTAGSPGELESRTSEIVGAACEREGSVALSALEPPLSALGVRPELRAAWIARLDDFEVADGFVRPWPRDESGQADAVPETGETPAAAATVEASRPGSEGRSSGLPLGSAPETEVVPAPAPLPSPDPTADPGEAARCFRDDHGVWWYRVDVDTALLDGERLPLPPQFVLSLGLRPDQSLRLHHAAGPAALRWEHEPFCVSLRAILAGLGAEDGDMVFIGSVRPGRLETRLLAGDGKLRLPRWARALRHTGVDPVPDQVNLPALLGARLGLDENCDLKAVLKRLQDRGDTDVLELLGVAPAR